MNTQIDEQNQKLYEENKNLIYKIARSKGFKKEDFEDLAQEGAVGLLKAAQNYQDGGNAKFSTYAYYDIYGQMYQYNLNRNLKVSRDYLRTYKKIEQTRYSLAQKLNRVPSNQELAEFLELDITFLEDVINSSKEIMSLDAPIYDDTSVYEVISDNKENNLDKKIDLWDSIKTLPLEQQKIILYRYYNDMTQMEIAKKMGMTQAMVSRYEQKGIKRIRQNML